MLAGVLAEARHLHPEDLGSLLRRWGAPAGVRDPVIYIADRDQAQLTALEEHTGAAEPVEGSLAGRCYQRGEPILVDNNQGHAWFPLTNGTSRVGVMRARLDPTDPSAMGRSADLASLAAYLLVAKAPLSDRLTRLVLSTQFGPTAMARFGPTCGRVTVMLVRDGAADERGRSIRGAGSRSG
jgi:hypothetical protein